MLQISGRIRLYICSYVVTKLLKSNLLQTNRITLLAGNLIKVQPHNFTCRLYPCLFVQTTADLDKVVHSQVHSNSRAHTSDAKNESKALSLKTLTYAERQRDGRFISSCP